uniref:Uncharacterized protein n=1 Tax=Myotis myotis TaxID=51298 RepID=A0A7J7XZJ5_MYOMY|nr:hypothetical protein mMyoMyo1_011302 [Myotis myotis]
MTDPASLLLADSSSFQPPTTSSSTCPSVTSAPAKQHPPTRWAESHSPEPLPAPQGQGPPSSGRPCSRPLLVLMVPGPLLRLLPAKPTPFSNFPLFHPSVPFWPIFCIQFSLLKQPGMLFFLQSGPQMVQRKCIAGVLKKKKKCSVSAFESHGVGTGRRFGFNGTVKGGLSEDRLELRRGRKELFV